jgi:hypothetical protein
MDLKKVQDYYDQLFALYPNIPKRDIQRIMQFGLKAFLMHNNYGGDVLLQSPTMWLYCGKLMKDSIKYYEYYKRKIIIKIRINHKRLNIPWYGYYYFGLNRLQYEIYLNQKNKRGRPKKHFEYGNVILYKYFDECNLRNSGSVAIFKIPLYSDFGLSLYKQNFKTDKAELVLEREPLTFKDILISNYDYQFVKDYTKYKKTKDNG